MFLNVTTSSLESMRVLHFIFPHFFAHLICYRGLNMCLTVLYPKYYEKMIDRNTQDQLNASQGLSLHFYPPDNLTKLSKLKPDWYSLELQELSRYMYLYIPPWNLLISTYSVDCLVLSRINVASESESCIYLNKTIYTHNWWLQYP